MSYEEKGSWVYLLVFTGTYAGYVAVILARAGGGPVTEVGYRSPLLWSMGISVALAVLGRITIEVVRPSETYKLDPRDRDINRFSEYVGGGVLAVGMLVPFAMTLLEAHLFWIANAMYAVFALSAIVGAVTKLVSYRRGLRLR